jgi:hypothetical protein
MARREKVTLTRWDVATKVASGLREFGYPSVKIETIAEVLDAWIDGKRDHDLPRGAIGYLAGRLFDELDEAKPGSLANLPK